LSWPESNVRGRRGPCAILGQYCNRLQSTSRRQPCRLAEGSSRFSGRRQKASTLRKPQGRLIARTGFPPQPRQMLSRFVGEGISILGKPEVAARWKLKRYDPLFRKQARRRRPALTLRQTAMKWPQRLHVRGLWLGQHRRRNWFAPSGRLHGRGP
jgi:hypothetical protein